MANDLNSLVSQLLNADTLSALSSSTGVSQQDTKKVLTSLIPALLSGANNQAIQQSTAQGFLGALTQHANADTSNIASFFKNVDTVDGSKIINHLLGGQIKNITNTAAKSNNVKSADVSKILSAAAPFLMALLGKQLLSNAKKAKAQTANTDLVSKLLGSSNISGIASSLLGGSSKKSDDGLDLGDVAKLASLFLKK
ncbi:MAG: DUF937 domain-containing protein [Erysipelotrichaceae bacterium]|nr:DUF937 domain-containing protein [Erysipelotrichaceae bacterium]